MNTAVTRRHISSFLPEITPNSNKWRRGTGRGYRMKQKKESCQTRSVSDKSAQILSKKQIAQFRNTLKQNICVQILQEGYHRSFSELLFLLQSDQERRAAADPGSALWLQTPLEDQPDKLKAMRLHLNQAEQAGRTGSWSVVCDHRLFLAQFFSAPEDQWLSLHFYHSCADREQGGHSRPATEARACMAEIYLQKGDLQEATRQAELCIHQAEDGGWLDSTCRPLRLRARQTLWGIYARQADALLDAENYEEALKLLHKGHSITTEFKDKQMKGEAAYRLGVAYQRSGDHDTAKKFLNTCIQIYDTLQDTEGLVKAYKATAKSVNSEGNTDETFRCLEKLLDITRSSKLKHNLTDAFLYLGSLYYTMGQWRRACECFLQGYEVACNIEDASLVEKAQMLYLCQVLVSSACARSLIRKHSADLTSTSPTALRRLLLWKETDPAASTWS